MIVEFRRRTLLPPDETTGDVAVRTTTTNDVPWGPLDRSSVLTLVKEATPITAEPKSR